jgi:hypothetical protein
MYLKPACRRRGWIILQEGSRTFATVDAAEGRVYGDLYGGKIGFFRLQSKQIPGSVEISQRILNRHMQIPQTEPGWHLYPSSDRRIDDADELCLRKSYPEV